MAKVLAESTRLTSRASSHPLPIITDSSPLADFQGTQKGSQELRYTCMIDGIPLKENAVTAQILEALTKAVKVVKGYTPSFGSRACALITFRCHCGKRGGHKFVPNYCRSQGTRNSDHGGSGLQGNYAKPSSKTSKEM